MFDNFYSPIPDVEKYLERIGMKLPLKADKETLDALILAHLRMIPFENLDMYDVKTDILLDIPSLYDKIVTRRRGGFCFETNALFGQLLKDLGYDWHPVVVRVLWGPPYLRPLSHRAEVVTIDGVRYYADIGFGGPAAQSSLLLDKEGPQLSRGRTFTLEKKDGVIVISNGDEKILGVYDNPFEPLDFFPLSEYQSKSKNSKFTQSRMANLTLEDGSKTLNGNVFKINQGGKSQEQILETEAEIKAVLSEHFGINVDFPLRMY